jgi:hypothetical protein
MSFSGQLSMSRFVLRFSFYSTVIITRTRFRRRIVGTLRKFVKLVVSITAAIFLFAPHYDLSPTFDIDGPEYGPDPIASNVYMSSASAAPTAPSTRSHSVGHAGVIAGGVIGGITIIFIAVAHDPLFTIHDKRSQASVPDQCQTMGRLCIHHSDHGQHMKIYVRVFMAHVLRLCVFMRHFLTIPIHLGPK